MANLFDDLDIGGNVNSGDVEIVSTKVIDGDFNVFMMQQHQEKYHL